MDASSESSGKTKKQQPGGAGLAFLDELSSSSSVDEGQKKSSGNARGVEKKINVKTVLPKTGGAGGGDKKRLLDYSGTDSASSDSDADDQGLNARSGAKVSKSTPVADPRQPGPADKATTISSTPASAQGKPGQIKTPSASQGKGTPHKTPSKAPASNTVATTVPTFRSAVGSDEEPDDARPRSASAATAQKRRSYTVQSVAPDQKLAAVKKDVENISKLVTKNEQRDAFEKVLKSAEALAPNQRYAVLSKLVPHLALFSGGRKISLIVGMRALASPPMPDGDRCKLAVLLLSSFIPERRSTTGDGNDDDNRQDAAAALTSDPKSDAEELDKTNTNLEKAKARIEKFQNQTGSKKLADLEGILEDAKALKNPVVELECIVLILEKMDVYGEDGKEHVISSLCNTFGVRAVVRALFQTDHVLLTGTEAVAGTGYSAPDLLQNFIEEERQGVAEMAKTLQVLAKKQGKWLSGLASEVEQLEQALLRQQPAAPTQASQTRSVLMNAAALSAMPVKVRCVLLNLLSSVDADTLPSCLLQAGGVATKFSLETAHQAIALAISAFACRVLLRYADNETSEVQANLVHFFSDRVGRATGEPGVRATRKKDSAAKKKDVVSSPSFRDMLVSGDDPDSIKKSIKEILTAKNLSFSEKLARLEARASPVADNLIEYTNKQYLAAAREKLEEKRDSERHQGKGEKQKIVVKENRLLDYEYYVRNTSQYSETMAAVSKSLSAMERQTIMTEVKKKMNEALKSKLPALHVAIMEDRLDAVEAYLASVLKNTKTNSEEQIKLLEMKHGKQGKTAFYRAMFNGSPEMIALWVQAIDASALDLDAKQTVLEARRTDELAAFYVAMSDGKEKSVKAFIESVLASKLPALYKERLLKAKTPFGKRTLQLSARQITLESTARNQALRTEAEWKKRVAHHSVAGKVGFDMHERYLGPRDRKDRPSLVPVFDALIFNSAFSGSIKATLTKPPVASF